MNEQQPGQIVTPGSTPQEPVAPVATQSQSPAPPAVLAPQSAVPTVEPAAQPVATAAPQEQAVDPGESAKYQVPEQFTDISVDQAPEQQPAPDDAITWNASEYIAHHKSSGWYIIFALTTIVSVVGIYFITGKDILSAVVIAVIAVVFAIYAARPPKIQQYSITNQGIAIGEKYYLFQDFKSFSIIDEGAFSSIAFMPLKRFMPVISIYFDPQDEDAIVQELSIHLPFDHKNADFVDRLMKKIRF